MTAFRPSPGHAILALAIAFAMPASVSADVGTGGMDVGARGAGLPYPDSRFDRLPESSQTLPSSDDDHGSEPVQVAQYDPAPRRLSAPQGRAISDHDHARLSTRAGENRGFEELMRSAQARGRGEYLGVEPDIDRNVYRFKFLRSGGNVVWVDVDGRTGRVVAERD